MTFPQSLLCLLQFGRSWRSPSESILALRLLSAVVRHPLCPSCTVSYTDSDGGTTFEGCGVVDSTAYYYPEEDTYQYLYETFPEVKKDIAGTVTVHFTVENIMFCWREEGPCALKTDSTGGDILCFPEMKAEWRVENTSHCNLFVCNAGNSGWT